jgi:hypothetical protein
VTGRHRAQQHALLDFGASLQRFGESVGRLNDSFRRVGMAFALFARALTPPVPIPPHAFTPNYDLACTRCPRTAEEH